MLLMTIIFQSGSAMIVLSAGNMVLRNLNKVNKKVDALLGDIDNKNYRYIQKNVHICCM